MIILANDGIDKSAQEELISMGHEVDINKYEKEELFNRLKEIDAIVIRSATKLFKEEIDAAAEAGKCKLFIRAGVGLDNIDVAYAESKDIEVRNTPGASSDAVAQLALAHMLMLSRHLVESNITMRKGQWNKKAYRGVELTGKTLGLIGSGRIAKSLARFCTALGMKVVYTNRNMKPIENDEYRLVDLEELLKTSDYVSLHVPSQEEPIIRSNELHMMKKTAFLINTARGGVVDEQALVQALEEGIIAGAAVDVFEEEPLKNEELLKFDNLSLSPHIGASTVEAQARIGENIVEIIKEKTR